MAYQFIATLAIAAWAVSGTLGAAVVIWRLLKG